MSIATFISRILGLVRDSFFAFYFGTSWTYDVYLLSFLIPQFLRKLVAEGALSSSAIPIMVEYKEKENRKEFLDSLFTYSIILMIVVVILGVVFARELLYVFATGIINNPQKMKLAILLTQIMFPFIGFISIASLVMGLLNSYKIFFPSALAPSILNVSVITSIIISAYFFNVSIIVPAIGVSVGGFLQLMYQMFYVKKVKYKFSFNFHFHPGLKEILNLFWPIFLSYGITQINSMVDLNLASWLPSGAISSLQYALRLFQLPIGVFAVAFSTAMLPRFSESYLKDESDRLKSSLSLSLSQMSFFIFPIVFIYLSSSQDIISILFGHGKFGIDSIRITSKVLIAYTIGIIGYSYTYLFSRFFTGMKDTKTPLKINIFAVILNISLDLILVIPFHQFGLALATSMSGILSSLLLYIKIKKNVGPVKRGNLIKISLLSTIFLLSLFIKTKNSYINIFVIDSILLIVYIGLSHLWKVNYLHSLFKR
jgi:putative peptidoglycan lipid II flippase